MLSILKRQLKQYSLWSFFCCFIFQLVLTSGAAHDLNASSQSSNAQLAFTIQQLQQYDDLEVPTTFSLTCFSTRPDKDQCCHLILRSGLASTLDKCLNEIATVPDIQRRHNEDLEEPLPFYFYSLNTSQMMELCSNTNDISPCHTNELSSGYQQYLYNDEEMKWSIWPSRVRSPLHLASTSKPLSQAQQMTTLISSTLSDDGGMHRPYHHTISMTLPQNDSTPQQAQRISGIVVVMLPIPKDLFLDVDDPFTTNDNNCQISMGGRNRNLVSIGEKSCLVTLELANEPGVIDIEQPSFSSPSHLVSLQIQLDLDLQWGEQRDDSETAQQTLMVNFETMLHLRYPAPIGKEEKRRKNSVYVEVPLAFVTKGWIQLKSSGEALKYDLNPKTKLNESLKLPTIDAKAGSDQHYDFVMVTTLLIAILGAWLMMMDLSKVAFWR